MTTGHVAGSVGSAAVRLVALMLAAIVLSLAVKWLGGWHVVYDSVSSAVLVFVDSIRIWLRT